MTLPFDQAAERYFTPPEQTREEVLSERLHMALGHLMATEGLAEGDEVVHIQMAKTAVCRVLRALEPPLEGGR